jgi:Ni,Fe-hydrogenase I large subunit
MKTLPVTRLEGHLGISLETADGVVTAAHVSGEMFRGIEVILQGRDPLDAQRITQSICGVCPIEHGIASVFAQEAAYGVDVPENGRLVRNLIQAGNFIASHLTHFYLLSGLDFANVAGVLEYQGADGTLVALRDFAKAQLAPNGAAKSKLVAPLGPLLPQPQLGAIKDADLNNRLLLHYAQCLGLESAGIRTIAHKMIAVFSGKVPHAASLVPGGVTEQVTALKVEQFRGFLDQVAAFVENAYWPDVVAAAGAFPEYFQYGRNRGGFLCYGGFPEKSGRRLPSGVLIEGKLQPFEESAITEDVKHSWFANATGLPPKRGETTPAPDKADAYSWLKAPRYQGLVMEVGPLARMLVAAASGHEEVRRDVTAALKISGRKTEDLNSVLGRHLARAVETRLLVRACAQWLDELQPGKPAIADYTVPDKAEGVGLTEAARGALGHWIRIANRKIANYQCVVPTTWNCSPRDDRNQPGPVEQALVGTPNPDPSDPLAAMRVIRSFDPCLACAVH